MARKKKQRKRTWLRTLLVFLLVPLAVWFVAFLLWFNWYELNDWLAPHQAPPAGTKAASPSEKNDSRERAPTARPRERIFDEDRKQLEEILKRRS